MFRKEKKLIARTSSSLETVVYQILSLVVWRISLELPLHFRKRELNKLIVVQGKRDIPSNASSMSVQSTSRFFQRLSLPSKKYPFLSFIIYHFFYHLIHWIIHKGVCTIYFPCKLYHVRTSSN